MKTFALTITALFAFCALAIAGPEPIASSSKEVQQVATVPPPCPTFGGFYIGMSTGFKYANVDPQFRSNDVFESEFGSDFADQIREEVENDLSTWGAELGGVIGFNWQTHSNWVFGVEAGFSYLWLRDSSAGEFEAEGDFSTSESFKTNYLFTFGPRIGYAFCRWMPYITGGLAVGNIEVDQNVHVITERRFFEIGDRYEETNCGWFIGAGLEYAFNTHWKIRGQYEYIDLGSASHNAPLTFDGETFSDEFFRQETDLTEHNFSVALIWGF